MKKVFIIVSILLFVVSLSAFAEDKIVGFSQVDNQNPWRLAETESVKSEAAARGYDLKYADAQAVQADQIKALRSFIAQGVDGIILAPKTSTGWKPVLLEAQDAGIPVVLVDRNIEADPNLVVTFIGSDFVLEGERTAEQMIKDLGEGPLKVAELQGQPGADPTIDRAEGFRNVVDKYSEIEIILSQTGEFNRHKGKEVMEAFLKADGDNIDAVYAHNDDMAIGAIQAIKEYGMVPGKDIWIGSIDGVRDAFVAMKAQELNVSVECTPLMGPSAFDALESAWGGEELPDWIVNEDGIFTMDQVDQAVLDSRKY
ncbi:MAG: ABC transporter substrate-binding protein [bacterium]|nr:ABC transporter substrate-binding protein [bacterium]